MLRNIKLYFLAEPDVPYCELWRGTLEVRELPIFSHEDDFWWLRETTVDFNDSEDSD